MTQYILSIVGVVLLSALITIIAPSGKIFNIYAFQSRTVSKCTSPETLDSVSDGYALKSRVIIKSILSDALYIIGNYQICYEHIVQV